MIEGQEGVTWDQWVALARACEDHGLQGLFRSDHYLSFDDPGRRGALDAWTTIAALAPITDRIRLGTMVSPVTFRHPSMLAKAVVTADHASGGRVELGMGAGWFQREHEAYGFPFPSAAERMDILTEQVEIVHRLWDRDEDAVTFDGRYYRLDGCVALPKPFQRPHPPLIIGGGAGPRSVALAARWADEYDVHAVDPGAARERRERVVAACEAIDRDPSEIRFSIMTTSVVGADRAELERRVRRWLDVEGQGEDVEGFLGEPRAHQLVGTVDQVLDRLQAFAEAGVQRVLLQHLVHDDLEMIELVGREIVPAVADL
jgi:F420-dependent oxidoreductase-like protein